jgi:hypothetical protein
MPENSENDLSLVLMAIATILGIWDREMRIPEPNRLMLVEIESHHWKLDARGYPMPSKELIAEVGRLQTGDEDRDTRTAQN